MCRQIAVRDWRRLPRQLALSGLPVDLPPRKVTEEDVQEFVTRLTDDAGVAELLLRLAQAYPDLDPEDQQALRRLSQAWVKIAE